MPSGEHDKARNIVADPGAGLDRLVRELDESLLADPELAGLPGRFLLAVAGPGGPVLAEPWDVAIVDEGGVLRRDGGASKEGTARILVDGRSVVVPRPEAPTMALDVARRFLAARGDERTWNVRDLPEADRACLLPGGAPFAPTVADPPPPGPVGEDLVALVPLGLLTPVMARALADEQVVVTPWRSVVVRGGAARAEELADAGLITAPDSPWTVLTACAGAPSCGRTTTPTRDLARAAAPFVDPAGPLVHVIGCERSCGRPARAHATALDPTSVADIVAAQRSPLEEDL